MACSICRRPSSDGETIVGRAARSRSSTKLNFGISALRAMTRYSTRPLDGRAIAGAAVNLLRETQNEMDHPGIRQGGSRRMPMAHKKVRGQGRGVFIRAVRQGDG